MGKRSSYPRAPRDLYPTPRRGAEPLFQFLRRDRVRTFAEFCAGPSPDKYQLVQHLEAAGFRAVYAGDIATGRDALTLTRADLNGADAIVTNPPTKHEWENPKGSTTHLLCDLIQHGLDLGVPAWLLIAHDFVTSLKATPYLKYCPDIVVIPRMKWFPGSKSGAMDSFSWFKFDPAYRLGTTVVHHRDASLTSVSTCQCCGRPFEPVRSSARFCSDRCRQRAHRAHQEDAAGVTMP
ncbi:hypothetical protein [Bradyrhizobium sp. F1.13.3]|uniref:hypothetical protein n=1 Tax=Bradyrhizobium sp. F1.13.3 TaxID=3156351 RepID=UPI003397E0F1